LTVHGDSLGSVVNSSKNEVTDTEIKNRIIGVSAQMASFEYLFGTLLVSAFLETLII